MTSVTTSTVTTTTALGLTAVLGAIATFVLIALLVTREVVGAVPGERTIRWTRVLNVGIIPLALAFAVIAAVKVAEVV